MSIVMTTIRISFKNRPLLLEPHNFDVETKFEILHPIEKTQFYPSNLVKVLNEYYFVLEVDTLVNSRYIHLIGQFMKPSLDLMILYSSREASTTSDEKNGDSSSQSQRATPSEALPIEENRRPPENRTLRCVRHKNSADIFPVGWCAQNRLRLATHEEFDWTLYLKKRGGKFSYFYQFDSVSWLC